MHNSFDKFIVLLKCGWTIRWGLFAHGRTHYTVDGAPKMGVPSTCLWLKHCRIAAPNLAWWLNLWCLTSDIRVTKCGSQMLNFRVRWPSFMQISLNSGLLQLSLGISAVTFRVYITAVRIPYRFNCIVMLIVLWPIIYGLFCHHFLPVQFYKLIQTSYCQHNFLPFMTIGNVTLIIHVLNGWILNELCSRVGTVDIPSTRVSSLAYIW